MSEDPYEAWSEIFTDMSLDGTIVWKDEVDDFGPDHPRFYEIIRRWYKVSEIPWNTMVAHYSEYHGGKRDSCLKCQKFIEFMENNDLVSFDGKVYIYK